MSFEIIIQLAFWVLFNKVLYEIHSIINYITTNEINDRTIKNEICNEDIDKFLEKYDKLAGVDRYNGMIK